MVQLTYPIGKGGFIFRHINVMDVIVHKIGPNQTNPIPLEMLREQSEVDNSVMGREKDGLSVVTPLGDMVGPTWDHNSESACHRLYCLEIRHDISGKKGNSRLTPFFVSAKVLRILTTGSQIYS